MIYRRLYGMSLNCAITISTLRLFHGQVKSTVGVHDRDRGGDCSRQTATNLKTVVYRNASCVIRVISQE